MSQSSKLYRLQQIDSQLDQAHQRLQEIENALKEDSAMRKAKQQAQAAKERLQTTQKALKQSEENTKAQNTKIELTESNLYGGKIRNPKELQDLQSEVAALKRYLSVLEDRQLEAMMELEEAEVQQSNAENNLKHVAARLTEEHASLKGEQSILSSKVERLEVEREAALRSISKEDLTLYGQLRKKRRGVAVAKISQAACGACGSTISTAILQSAAQSELTHCPTCGRILYVG